MFSKFYSTAAHINCGLARDADLGRKPLDTQTESTGWAKYGTFFVFEFSLGVLCLQFLFNHVPSLYVGLRKLVLFLCE